MTSHSIPENPTAVNPDIWTIRTVGTLPQARALRDAGCRVGRHVLTRTCAQCSQPGDVLVSNPDQLADAVAFITAPGWRCNTCRRADTAHWVPSPKTSPATSTPSGTTGQSHRRRSALRAQCSQRQRAITRWQQQYDGARATLDLIAAGLMPATLQPRMEAMLIEARHQLARLGIVLEVAS